MLTSTRHRLRLIVFLFGLGLHQLRDDPARALRLAARIVLKLAPARLRRTRLGRLTVPRPRDPRREAADLNVLLAARSGAANESDTRPPTGIGDDTQIMPGSVHVSQDIGPGDLRVMYFVTNALPRTNAGYTVRTHKIAVAQRAAGLDPHVVTRLGYPLSQGIADARPLVEVDGISYHRLIPWLPPRTPLAGVRRGADHAEELVRELKPAVLHAVSNHLNAAVALELRRRHGLWTVYEVRGFLEDSWLSRDSSHSTSDDFYRLTRELETACMREADRIVTLGEAMRDEIASRGIDRDKIIVVPNAVDDVFLEPLPDGAPVRARLGIGRDDFVVGLTSSFYGYEGIDTLIEAAALLRDKGTPITLLLVGDGPERGALERLAARHGLLAGDAGDTRDLNDTGTTGTPGAHSGTGSAAGSTAGSGGTDGGTGTARVIFTGRVPMGAVREHHAALDVFAVPRRADRVCQLVTPLKPVEAMAGGIPVLASDVGALREIVEHGVTGVLTEPENPEAWAESMLDLLYSRQERQRIGQAALEWVAAERTWRAVTARYHEAYLPVRNGAG